MAVLEVEQYRQLNGEDVLKVILKSTQRFPEGYFYCDSCDEELIKSYTWRLHTQKESYVVAVFGNSCNYNQQTLRFHREKAFNILGYYPDYINHINGIEFDNVNANLDEVTNQQNQWCKLSKGYWFTGRSFRPYVIVNSQNKWGKNVEIEVEACQSAYQLEVIYKDYRYDFFKDRRKDADILDLERTGKISEEEAVYHHVCRYALDNAWYVYRYDLFEYFRDNHIPVPAYSIDSDGFMCHSVTGQRLCPI